MRDKFCKLTVIILLFITTSCGKKTQLDRYPGSDYPKVYPKQDE